MRRPEPGLCIPVMYRYCRDGDTVVVSLSGSFREWAIRLIDCWCPELHSRDEQQKQRAIKAKEYAEDVLDKADSLYLWIPAPKHVDNLLKNLTFDRIPGYLFVSSMVTLNEMMVMAGHATKEKST